MAVQQQQEHIANAKANLGKLPAHKEQREAALAQADAELAELEEQERQAVGDASVRLCSCCFPCCVVWHLDWFESSSAGVVALVPSIGRMISEY